MNVDPDFESEIRRAAQELGRAATPEYEFSRMHVSGLELRIKSESGSRIELDQCSIPIKVTRKVVQHAKEESKTTDISALNPGINYAVLGEPGSGKSVFMQRAAIKRARTYKDGEKIPVYVVLAEYDGSSLEDFLVSQMRANSFSGTVRDMLNDGRFELFLDGLDEVNVERDKLVNHLRNLGSLNRNIIWVASRPNNFPGLSTFADARINAPNMHDIKHFLEYSYHKTPYNHRALLKKIEGDNILEQLCRNPLMLSFVMELYEHSEDEGKEFEVRDKNHLYEQIVELFFGRESEKGRDKALTRRKIQAFSEIAFMAQAENGTGRVSRTEVEEIIDRVFQGDDEYKALVWQEINENGLLRFNERIRSYEFGMHKSLQEYFCARAMAEKINAGEVSVEDLWQKYLSFTENRAVWRTSCAAEEDFKGVLPAWQNTMILLGGMLKQAHLNRLIEAIAHPYFAMKEASVDGFPERGSPELMHFFRMLTGGPSYSHPQDYNPFVHNLHIAVNMLYNSRREKPLPERTEFAKKLLNEIHAAGIVLNRQNIGDNLNSLYKKIFASLGETEPVAGYVCENSEAFGIEGNNPEKTAKAIESFRDTDRFVDAVESAVYGEKIKIKESRDNGEILCRCLDSLKTPKSKALLEKIKADFWHDSMGVRTYFFVPEPLEPSKGLSKWGLHKQELNRMPLDEYKEEYMKTLRAGEGQALEEVDILFSKMGPEALEFILEQAKIPAYRAIAVEHLAVAAEENKGTDLGRKAKKAFINELLKTPKIMEEMHSHATSRLKNATEAQDANDLAALYKTAIQLGYDFKKAGYNIDNIGEALAATKTAIAVETLADTIERLPGPLEGNALHRSDLRRDSVRILASMQTYEAYRAITRFIMKYGEIVHRDTIGACISTVSEMEGILKFEEMADDDFVGYLIHLCKRGIYFRVCDSRPISRFRDPRAIEPLMDQLREVSRKSGNHFYSTSLIESLGDLCEQAIKIGIPPPKDAFGIITGLTIKEKKLLPWHEHALKRINPVGYIHFAQTHIPANYGHPGIEPLYSAVFKTHKEMIPQGYKAQRGAA